MKPGFVLFAVVALATASLALSAHASSLSDLDVDWFRENPSPVSWGPDPFVPKVSMGIPGEPSGPAAGGNLLSAVILGGQKPAAVLNGVVVHQGDIVRGSKVLRIMKNSVLLKGSAGSVEIPLKPLFNVKNSLP